MKKAFRVVGTVADLKGMDAIVISTSLQKAAQFVSDSADYFGARITSISEIDCASVLIDE